MVVGYVQYLRQGSRDGALEPSALPDDLDGSATEKADQKSSQSSFLSVGCPDESDGHLRFDGLGGKRKKRK